jgi:hypothetical protein
MKLLIAYLINIFWKAKPLTEKVVNNEDAFRHWDRFADRYDTEALGIDLGSLYSPRSKDIDS